MPVAALILARAEGAGLAAGKAILAPAERARLARELAAWGRVAEVGIVADLLVRADLLVQDDARQWRPTPAAYEWLRLPYGAAVRRLLAESGFPFTAPLTKGAADALVACGLAEKDSLGHRVLAAHTPAVLALLHDPQPMARQKWVEAFADYTTRTGWLHWSADNGCLTFATPNVWQLFRILAFCIPHRTHAGTFGLAFAPDLIAAARARGMHPARDLRRALAAPLPPEIEDQFEALLTRGRVFRFRHVTLLEAEDRAAFQPLLTDRALRPYVTEWLSPRHAVIAENERVRLRRMFERRGMSIAAAPDTEHPYSVRLLLTRRDIQTLVGALRVYRQMTVADGGDVAALDSLVTTLEHPLTWREQREAESLAVTFAPNPTELPQPTADTGDAPTRIEHAISAEADMTIIYRVPGRQPEQRRVTPMQVYTENAQTYLVAYCHLRKAQRTFRVDRLQIV